MSLTAKLFLSPLLVAQALRTRARLPKLPEAAGERAGVAHPPMAGTASVAEAPPLKLLVAGDSSAAGVGVAYQRHALAQPLAEALAKHAQRCVHWRLIAQSGLTTAQMHALLREQQGLIDADIAVVVTGVNDVVEQIPSHRAVAAREALANWLRNACGVHHVAFAPLPPVHEFPGLPQPLRWVAGTDARRHNLALQEWTAQAAAYRSDISRVPLRLRLHHGVMADDGFHPGAAAYRQVAREMARHLAQLVSNHNPSHLEEDADDPSTQPEGQDALHHRREPRHRPGDRQTRGGRRRQYRAGGQDHRAQPQAAGDALQRRR
jgi:lysophospholipase L1-like esterase